MPSSREQRRRPNVADQSAADKTAAEQVQQQEVGEELQLAQGNDMGPAQVSGLQDSVGNASLSTLLQGAGRIDGPELDTDQEVQLDEEGGVQLDEAFADYLGALGARESLVGSADVDDWQRLFGGDPDAEPPPHRRMPRQLRYADEAIPARSPDESELAPPEPEEELLELPPLGEVSAPEADERLDALWAWLRDPLALADPDFQPESLVEGEGPLGRCGRLGAFLERRATTRLARALGGLARPLTGSRSLSGQVARAASLAELGCHAEPLDILTMNRVAAVSLEADAGTHARAAARICVQQRRLRADRVCDIALQAEEEAEPLLPPIPVPGQRASQLLAHALAWAARPAVIPDPGKSLRAGELDSTATADTADIDAFLRAMTGGLPTSTLLEYEMVAPVLAGADRLLLLAGRCQVELGAARIALCRCAGRGAREQVRALLRVVDRELVDIASGVARGARDVEGLIASPLAAVEADLEAREAALVALAVRLRRLRESAFETLGSRYAR